MGPTLFAISSAVAQDNADFLHRYLKAHCVECHGEEVQKRNLRLDTLPPEFAKPEPFAAWVKVHDKIESGEMPPAKRDRPGEFFPDSA